MQNRLAVWRVISLVLLLSLVMSCYHFSSYKHVKPYAARLYIRDMIETNPDMIKVIDELAHDDKVAAVLLHVDSSGGTFVGSESYFQAVRKVARKKPVITLVDNCALSGGYMVATAANYIIAYNGSMVGSIGVLMRSFEVTNLMEKLGITPIIQKSSPLKATPNYFEKMTPEAEARIQSAITDLQRTFVSMLRDRRPQIDLSAFDGAMFTGQQALQIGLIDAIGTETDALEWLAQHHNIPRDIDIEDVMLERQSRVPFRLLGSLMQHLSSASTAIAQNFNAISIQASL